MTILEQARAYVSRGISVIPVKADGSKSPAFSGWRDYANKLPTDVELARWFAPQKKIVGIGIPCGPASGNLVILDFEHHGTSAYLEWIQRLPEDLRKQAQQLPTVTTPSGGKHIYCRLEQSQPGGKLARYAATGKTKIEIRGEGHQVLAPGCPAECHISGRLYEWLSDPVFQVVDALIFHDLVEHAIACNEFSPPEQSRDAGSGSGKGTPAGDDSPGNDFNLRGAWEETGLFEAGWKWCKKLAGDRGFLTRPGKETGISASLGMVSSKAKNYPYLFVWSTAADFVPETPFSKFHIYTVLKHNGDYSEAAKELYRQGYGARFEQSEQSNEAEEEPVDLSGITLKINTPNGEPFTPFQKPPKGEHVREGEDRDFYWLSELDGVDDDRAKWIWKGYIPRGGIVLFSALPKCGKSTLLSHLLKALDGSRSEFLGLELVPARVLVVTEEGKSLWRDRRNNLLIGDHVAIISRPFGGRPTAMEWKTHIAKVAKYVDRYQFDLVIYDTVSKMWPCKDENEASQVEEALMPLWLLTKGECSVVLVHHMRKSDGIEFTGARGSGGISAFCEVLMELRRPPNSPSEETRRVITANGRYDEIPHKKEIDFKAGRYTDYGDPKDPAEQVAKGKKYSWESELLSILEQADKSLDAECLVAELKIVIGVDVGVYKVNQVLAKFMDSKDSTHVTRTGKGVRGDPRVYILTSKLSTSEK